jgi:hypothetical protein
MIYRGHVENGVVVLHDGVRLPDGAEVKVELLDVSTSAGETEMPTLYERLKSVVGVASGLPEDLAAQHDHYIHGTPKK